MLGHRVRGRQGTCRQQANQEEQRAWLRFPVTGDSFRLHRAWVCPRGEALEVPAPASCHSIPPTLPRPPPGTGPRQPPASPGLLKELCWDLVQHLARIPFYFHRTS